MRSKRKEPPETFLLYHIYYNKIYCFSTFFNRLKNCNHIKPARDDIAGRLLESQQLLFFAIEFLLGEKSLLLQLGELADFIRETALSTPFFPLLISVFPKSRNA